MLFFLSVVFCVWFSVYGFRCMVCGVWFLSMVFSAWFSVYGSLCVFQNVVSCVWFSVFGCLCVFLYNLSPVYGLQCRVSAYGFLCMVFSISFPT